MRHDQHWFRCYPDAALTGSEALTDAQFAVYWRLIFKMYATGGPVPYDDQRLKHLLHKRPQDIRRLVGELVMLGKLTVLDGHIHNGRSDYELQRMNEKWRPNGEEMPDKWRENDGQMALHLPGHNPEKPSKNNERPASAHASAHAHPRQKIEDRYRRPAAHTAGAAYSTDASALPPREAGSPGLGGRSPPAQVEPAAPHPADAMTPEARAEMQRKFAELSASLSSKLSMPDIPTYKHKPREIADATDADATRAPDAGGDQPSQGSVPEHPAGTARGQPGNAEAAEDQGRDLGTEPPADESPLIRALRRSKQP